MTARKKPPTANEKRLTAQVTELTEANRNLAKHNEDLQRDRDEALSANRRLTNDYANQANKLVVAVGVVDDIERIANGLNVSRYNTDTSHRLAANVGYGMELTDSVKLMPEDPQADFNLEQQKNAVTYEARLVAISALCCFSSRLSSS